MCSRHIVDERAIDASSRIRRALLSPGVKREAVPGRAIRRILHAGCAANLLLRDENIAI